MPSRLVVEDKERVGVWVAERVEQTASWGDFYAMGVERNGELVAGIVMNNYNGVNATCHIAIARPGKDVFALFREFSRYAFELCGLVRLTGLVPDNKPDVLAFDLKLGFERECVLRKAAPGGYDMHVLVMWMDKCRWLNRG